MKKKVYTFFSLVTLKAQKMTKSLHQQNPSKAIEFLSHQLRQHAESIGTPPPREHRNLISKMGP